MALLFCDGFDWYTTADITLRWTANGTSGQQGSVAGSYARAPSGQGCYISGANGTGGPMYVSFGANYTQGIVGFAWRHTSVANKILCYIFDGTSEQISIRTNASSVPTVTRNGTVLATGSTVLSANVWYYFELKFTINNSTGVVELKLNGASEIASTGSLNTRNTANTQWNGFGYGQNNLSSTAGMIDDVYAIDPASGSNTDFLGPVQVVARRVAGNGATAAWTPNGGTNAGCVGEDFEDGDTSFNQSSTADQVDTFAMQDLPAASGSVFSVVHHMVARQDAGAARSIAPVMRPASTDRVGTTVNLSTSYQVLSQIYDTSPETSSAWDVSGVNSLEAGYKLIS